MWAKQKRKCAGDHPDLRLSFLVSHLHTSGGTSRAHPLSLGWAVDGGWACGVDGENVGIARSSHAFGIGERLASLFTPLGTSPFKRKQKEVGILSLVVIRRPVKNAVLTAIRHEL
jgi:hypothetical protein